MKQVFISFFLIVLMSMVGEKSYAYDIAVKNKDGVTICYNYISDDKEMEVTHFDYYNKYDSYSGNVVIPEEVSYMNKTRKVTSIGNQAFVNCPHLTSITLPNSVKSIGEKAFSGFCLKTITLPNSVTTIGNYAFEHCLNLTSITLSNSLTSIGDHAFEYCKHLTSITLPNSLKSIGDMAFISCYELTSIIIPNSVTTIGEGAFWGCSGLTSVTIPNSVTNIGYCVFYECSGLTSITIPNSVTTIGISAFCGCSSLTSLTIPNSVTTIESSAFRECSGLTSLTIPNSLTSLGSMAFYGCDIPIIISLIENPFSINGKTAYNSTFSQNTFNNATLYVPAGAIDKYKSTDGWKDFLFIEEGTGGGSTTTPKKCEKPTISYSNGKLKFTSGTEGASCQYNITDTDIKSGSGNEVQLTVTYSISAYATKAGYDNSETVTATLCWIDVNPKTEGIESAIANVRANPVLIQSNGGVLNISGVNDGTDIVVYSVSGQMVGTSKAKGNQTSVFTNTQKGEIVIVKIGDKSVKVVMQ